MKEVTVVSVVTVVTVVTVMTVTVLTKQLCTPKNQTYLKPTYLPIYLWDSSSLGTVVTVMTVVTEVTKKNHQKNVFIKTLTKKKV